MTQSSLHERSITVNGKRITFSGSLDPEKFKERISVALGTLPPLLGDISINVEDGGNFTLEDPIFYLDDDKLKIRRRGDNSIMWREIESNTPLMTQLDPFFLKKLYIVSKVEATIDDFGGGISPEQAVSYAFFDLETELEYVDESVWTNRTTIINEFKEMLRDNINHVKKQTQISNIWGGIKPSFESSVFILTKVNHETEILNSFDYSELMVFDSVKLDNVVVGCFYQDMVKYNADYKHLTDEYLNQEKMLTKKNKASDIVRIMITANFPNIRIKYKMINIHLTKEKKIALTIETLINEPRVTDILKNLIKKIVIDMGAEEAFNQRIEKEFFYGSYTASINIPTLVLKDLTTNDRNVTNICHMNESALINTHNAAFNLFLKNSDHTTKQEVSVSFFERPDTVGTLIKLKKIRGGIDLQTKIDSNIEKVNKILEYAHSKVESILNFYKQYIELNVDAQPFKKHVDVKAFDQAQRARFPEIFVTNYTRVCNKPPVIVENEGVENALSDDQKMMKFPIFGETEPLFFKCPYPDHKYPGLRENSKLSNSEVFPFVPCCYQRPQKDNKNFKAYFNQEVFKQRINLGEIGKTFKILSPQRIGVLPPKIDKLLNYSTNKKFYRFGTRLSNSSCLDVLKMVTKQDETSTENIRSELAKRAELCKCELNTLSVADIKKKIMDPATYVSPRLFKGALEDYFQISYILFSKEKDDFSSYPNRFVRFICPLKKKIIFMIEHEEGEHVELIIDEETMNYVNKQGAKPIFAYEKSDHEAKKIFSIYLERFNYILYDVTNKGFKNLELKKKHYPWEETNANGKISKPIEPLNQFVDGFGQTRLVEFKFEDFTFVGQFEPLPCIRLPIQDLDFFSSINGRLSPEEKEIIAQRFPWCTLFVRTVSMVDETKSFENFHRLKKLAEYILWAACHVYSTFYLENEDLTVDEWITNHTRIVENYTYSRVTIQPLFDISELMVDGKFIFNSVELQNRIRFNISLLSSVNLKMFSTKIYHSFFNDKSNFRVEFPAQLALSKRDYFERTREPYILHILTSENLKYLRSNVLYFIKDLFGYFQDDLCLFHSSIDDLVTSTNKLLFTFTLGKSMMKLLLFNHDTTKQYYFGENEPSIDVIVLNINGYWFYGLILPKFL